MRSILLSATIPPLLFVMMTGTTPVKAEPADKAQLYQKARALEAAGDFEAAIAIYVQLLKDLQIECTQPIQGKKVPWRTACGRRMKLLYGIAMARKAQGNARKTRAALEAYLATWRRFFPQASIHNEARLLFHLAQSNRKLDPQSALDGYRKALRIWRRDRPIQRAPFAEQAQRGIAAMLARLSRFREAAAAYEALLKEHQARHKEPHPDAAHIRRTIDQFKKRIAGDADKKEDRKLALIPTRDPPAADPGTKAPSPFYKKWWFWTVVGVVVTGAATVGVIVANADTQVPGGPRLDYGQFNLGGQQ